MGREPESILVSIGMPVYNGLPHLRRALGTLVAQSHRNLEIIISDNASTDGTEALCRDFASRDARISYQRSSKNIGGAANFERVLKLARGEFFMWAAHDDSWAPTFVDENLKNLLARPEYVASMSRVGYRDGDREVWMPFIERADWRALTGSPAANVRHYVANSGMNSRFFAVFRRDVLLKCWRCEPFVAADNAIMVRTLAFGKHGEVNKLLFFRGMAGESARHFPMLTADRSFPGCLLPLWRYSRRVWAMPHVRRDFGMFISLLIVNIIFSSMLVISLIKQALRRRR